jgi:hypothetical protein
MAVSIGSTAALAASARDVSPQRQAARGPEGPVLTIRMPNGFVVEASDPRSTLELVEKLRERSGVRAAYSLIKRQQSPR